MFCKATVLILALAIALAIIGGDIFLPRIVGLYSKVTGSHKAVGLNPAFLTTEEKKRATFGSDELARDLSGEICLVTGANVGLGLETARWLYLNGCHVIASGRRPTALKNACKSITLTRNKDTENVGICTPMTLDLASLQSVKEFALEFKQKFDKLDIFVQNAGITFWKDRAITIDGIESMFQVNHLGHFYLTKLLDGLISKPFGSPTKIVTVSSAAHFGPVPPDGVYFDLEELNDISNFEGFAYYGQSKLANVLYAQHLSRHINSQTGRVAYVNSCGPGMTKTNVTEEFRIRVRGYVKDYPILEPLAMLGLAVFDFVEEKITWDTADGARTQLYLAISPEIEQHNITAKYFHPQAIEVPPSHLAQGEKGVDMAEKLWSFSEKILKDKDPHPDVVKTKQSIKPAS